MMLNSLALRGRSLFTISHTSTLPTSLRPLASHAITSAHQILNIVLDEPSIRGSMVGVPLYLHTVIAFAVVFLVKMSSRWAGIGVTIDPETKTKPQIEAVISLFRSCRAGKGHVIYAMADGFERLLRRNLANGHGGVRVGDDGGAHGKIGSGISIDGLVARQTTNGTSFAHPAHMHGQAHALAQHQHPPHATPPDPFHSSSSLLPPQHSTTSPSPFTPTNPHGPPSQTQFDPYTLSPHTTPSTAGTFGGWQTEDDMLWSMGMGYDLLATAPDVNAHGLSGFVGWPGSASGDGGPASAGGYTTLQG